MERVEVFENIDRIVEIELRAAGLPIGIMPRLYEEARNGGPPLSLTIARRLLDSKVQRVALVTGVVFGPIPFGEIDGPVGAAVLADALAKLDRSPVVVVPGAMFRVVSAIRKALRADFDIMSDEDVAATDFDAAVTVERQGRNSVGQHHSVTGAPLPISDVADDFVDAMNEAGKLTIGFGDGGNEIGFGALYESARKLVPGGSDCGCPCGQGLVTTTRTEIVFPVSVSNFGAYAVTTALGLLNDRAMFLPRSAIIQEALVAAIGEGCLDGGTFTPGFVGDDGIPFEIVRGILDVLSGIATQSFVVSPRHE